MKEYKKIYSKNRDNFLFIQPAHNKLNENAECEQVSGASMCCLKEGIGSIDMKDSKYMLAVS